ncbi:Thaumatin domain-containing protein [Cephalotus follicularis]|uniref:Thaumatin domain-containing protein n=1 Tax=Cephalotus follicularis TaxID=3775 RepID=A0A1Q3CRQ6_CEPFO|nr:Thaumatin domain-containing protein [Cephalotus follicularis]
MSSLNNLTIFLSFILTAPYLVIIFIDAAIFNIQNNCSYTIWAAANPGGGRQLKTSQTWVINTDPNFRDKGRIWARTNCVNNVCESGDCGGVLYCVSNGATPETLAEYAFNQTQNLDFLDISLVDGFNVPMEFTPMNSECVGVKCTADINRLCPTELRDPGGCNNPCTVFQNDQFCCIGSRASPATCGPTAYSKFFKDACPNVYTYAYDDASSKFTCPTGTDYKFTMQVILHYVGMQS